jgi:predicted nucleic acid-binding protein
MIVTDTNLIAYLLLGGAGTPVARAVFLRDPEWAAPLLWRSEFCSVLAGCLRLGQLRIGDAVTVQRRAEELLAGREHLVRSELILRLTASSTCSAYDCEFVALAEHLRVPLVTSDRRILRDFPAVALSPSRYLDGPA